MKAKDFSVVLLLTALGSYGCSSVPLPSLPSLPSASWFSSTAKADPTAEALFDEGTRYFNEKKYARAIDAFAKIKTDHPFSPVLTQTELKIADAYYLNKQYPEAINAFKEFQSLHPSNENIPFVVYRLGQAHFDQFSSTDRDQKNTQIAKGYFETIISKFPQSPYAQEAKQKLAKCIEYISEHDFNAAYFYFQQEKYPAARDRFEEIIRRYQGTPAAVKSLFFLGESYRAEKNHIKAALAYEALIQHYPQSKFAAEAKTQLAQLGKEKNDPLAMLLMRDRRPTASPPTEKTETADGKLTDMALVAKNEIVFEEPDDDKSFFRRVVDKINPFSDDGKKKTADKPPESWQELMAKKKAAEKEESPGFVASFWSGINPFGGRDSKDNAQKSDSSLVNQIDNSLQQKGISAESQMAGLKAPAAALPEPPAPVQTMDTGRLLGEVDSRLQKSGREVKELTPPKAAEAFTNPTVTEAALAAQKQPTAGLQSSNTNDLLSSIDQTLNKRGVKSTDFEAPPTPSEIKERSANQQSPKKNVEIEPKLALEKGPLFLNPAETQEITGTTAESSSQGKKPETADKEPATRDVTKALVKGPTQAQPATAKPVEEKKPVPGQDQENKGVFDQLRQDLDSIGKVLNPFRW
jgi:outer membrane protein assembly factor BamD